jgi:hypothetical protein
VPGFEGPRIGAFEGAPALSDITSARSSQTRAARETSRRVALNASSLPAPPTHRSHDVQKLHRSVLGYDDGHRGSTIRGSCFLQGKGPAAAAALLPAVLQARHACG